MTKIPVKDWKPELTDMKNGRRQEVQAVSLVSFGRALMKHTPVLVCKHF